MSPNLGARGGPFVPPVAPARPLHAAISGAAPPRPSGPSPPLTFPPTRRTQSLAPAGPHLRFAFVPTRRRGEDRTGPGCARQSPGPGRCGLAASAVHPPAGQLEGRGRRYPNRLPPSSLHQPGSMSFGVTHFLDVTNFSSL